LALGVKPKDVLTEALKYDIYGDVVRVFFGSKLIVFLTDARDVEIILSSPIHIDKSPEYRYVLNSK
jgi:cytochrome P450 family 4